mmetsp:Transcript_20093/g.28880  ORF Transcript_20093/g.28880 Transcript_20093/m.28880 type:complete len:93 (+) Transcript_20093:72-350(+)
MFQNLIQRLKSKQALFTNKLKANKSKLTNGINKAGKNIQRSIKINRNKSLSGSDLYSRIKNPRTEGEHMVKRILFGVGICCISIAASLIGLR